jgi:hypothetical protein
VPLGRVRSILLEQAADASAVNASRQHPAPALAVTTRMM